MSHNIYVPFILLSLKNLKHGVNIFSIFSCHFSVLSDIRQKFSWIRLWKGSKSRHTCKLIFKDFFIFCFNHECVSDKMIKGLLQIPKNGRSKNHRWCESENGKIRSGQDARHSLCLRKFSVRFYIFWETHILFYIEIQTIYLWNTESHQRRWLPRARSCCLRWKSPERRSWLAESCQEFCAWMSQRHRSSPWWTAGIFKLHKTGVQHEIPSSDSLHGHFRLHREYFCILKFKICFL